MDIEKIKELVKIFKEANYKDLFGALIINEQLDYMHDLDELNEGDIEILEGLFNRFMKSDNATLINRDLLDDLDDMEEM
jgi:hypothetical protein